MNYLYAALFGRTAVSAISFFLYKLENVSCEYDRLNVIFGNFPLRYFINRSYSLRFPIFYKMCRETPNSQRTKYQKFYTYVVFFKYKVSNLEISSRVRSTIRHSAAFSTLSFSRRARHVKTWGKRESRISPHKSCSCLPTHTHNYS